MFLNQICSLKPNVKRLALTVLIDFDREGKVINSEFFNSIIKSRIRFTYTEVARLLEKGDIEKKIHRRYGYFKKHAPP